MAAKEKATPDQRVLAFIRSQNLLVKGQKVVIAVSGGPDSVCLMQMLVNLRAELGVDLHVAHLDHQLRGAESAADAEYVAGLAQKLGVPATIEKRDVKAYQAEHKLSLEAAAREVRYDFLAEVAKTVGVEQVAVGHTLDDHIETILMHLVRGSGIKGLCGLQPSARRQFSGRDLTILRPLLQISRQETNDYCREHELAPRLDASNLSLSPLRNKIRLQLLPLLSSYNPRAADAILRTASIAAEDIAFLDEEVTRRWGEIERRGNNIVLDRKQFGELPSAVKRRLLRLSIETLLGNLKDIEARHIEEIMDALAKPAGKSISLPEGLNFLVDYDEYLLGKDPRSLCPFPVLDTETPLTIPGKTRLPGWSVDAVVADSSALKSPLGPTDSPFAACIDIDKVGGGLALRSRRAGDRFQPLGMAKPKKLNTFMIDARVSQSWRSRVPLVVSATQVLWVVGWRIDDRVKVTEATKRILCLRLARE